MNNSKFATKKDVIIILSILFVAFILIVMRLFFNRNIDAVYAEILLHGTPVKQVSINHEQTIYIDEVPQVAFEVRNGSIAFIKSDCIDQVCVNSGFLNRPGQMAACLPNGLTLMVVGDTYDPNSIDIFIN